MGGLVLTSAPDDSDAKVDNLCANSHGREELVLTFLVAGI